MGFITEQMRTDRTDRLERQAITEHQLALAEIENFCQWDNIEAIAQRLKQDAAERFQQAGVVYAASISQEGLSRAIATSEQCHKAILRAVQIEEARANTVFMYAFDDEIMANKITVSFYPALK